MCSQHFNSKWNLQHHLNNHNPKSENVCKICKKSFSYKSRLLRHMANHSVKVRRKCPECGENVINLESHIKIHNSNRKNYECNICKKTFLYQSSADRHKLTHTGQNIKTCPLCNEKCFNLASHLKLHKGVKRIFTCHQCKETFYKKHFTGKVHWKVIWHLTLEKIRRHVLYARVNLLIYLNI